MLPKAGQPAEGRLGEPPQSTKGQSISRARYQLLDRGEVREPGLVIPVDIRPRRACGGQATQLINYGAVANPRSSQGVVRGYRCRTEPTSDRRLGSAFVPRRPRSACSNRVCQARFVARGLVGVAGSHSLVASSSSVVRLHARSIPFVSAVRSVRDVRGVGVNPTWWC